MTIGIRDDHALRVLAVLRLALKANTDDTRWAPNTRIIRRLVSEGVRLRLRYPQAMTNMGQVYPQQTGWLQ